MTYEQFLAKAIEKYNEQSVTLENLQAAAKIANDDLTLDGAILDAILATLETRMTEENFINFCETL